VLHRKSDEKPIRVTQDPDDRELGNYTSFILEFHFKIIRSQDGLCPVNNLNKLSCRKPMVYIISNPALKAEIGVFSNCRTAVQKGFVHATDLGDVRM